MVQVASAGANMGINGSYPRLYRVQLAVLQARNRGVALCWLLGASALGVPPEGAIIPQSMLERDLDCSHHPPALLERDLSGRSEVGSFLSLGRELGEGRAQVLVQCWARRGS